MGELQKSMHYIINAFDKAIGPSSGVSPQFVAATENNDGHALTSTDVARRIQLRGLSTLITGTSYSFMLSGSQLAAKGTMFSFKAPVVKDGHNVAQLDKVEVNKLSKLWSTAMIMYVLGDSTSIREILRFILKEWNQVSQPKIFYHDEGYFVVKLQSIEDKNEILCFGPHTFNGKPMVVKAWSPNFNFHEEVLRLIP